MNRLVTATIAVALLAHHCSALRAQEWADLQIMFKYGGSSVPERSKLDMTKDPECAKFTKYDPSMIVNPDSMGIQNLVVFLDNKKSDMSDDANHPDAGGNADEPIVLDNLECIFEPHIVLIRPGDTIRVTNSDSTGHNANFSFFKNDSQNFLVPAGGSKDLTVKNAERFPMRVECNVHPWMSAYVVCLESPYCSVSDETGVLSIKQLPANRPLTFKLWHERMNKSFKEIKLDGKAIKLSRGYLEVTLKPGENSHEIEFGADEFK